VEESDEEVELETNRIIPGQPKEPEAATAVASTNGGASNDPSGVVATAAKRAAEVAARLMANVGVNKSQSMETGDDNEDARPVYAEEIIINDFPQKARWKVTNKVRKTVRRTLLFTNSCCH
jgi:ATP-dependent RNA helicase DDX46/PRP5